MNGRLIGILLESGIGMIAGIFLAYLGFLSPIFRRSSEQLAPDRWVGVFRIIARIVGPVLCIVAGSGSLSTSVRPTRVRTCIGARSRSTEGRFRISSPADFVKEVKDVPYGDGISESCFRALVSPAGVPRKLSSICRQSILKTEPNEVLNTELDAHVQATG